MTRIMRDSTSAADIPVAGTQLVAGYRNGAYAWSPADYARFPGIPHVYIDVNGSDPAGAGVLDIEAGDADVNGPVPARWCKERLALIKAGKVDDYPPICYVDRANLTPLFNNLNAAGLEVVRDFRLWIATLDGTKTVADMTGVTSVQYASTTLTGGHYDESIVYDDSWHRAPAPVTLRGLLVRPDKMTVAEVTSADGRHWS